MNRFTAYGLQPPPLRGQHRRTGKAGSMVLPGFVALLCACSCAWAGAALDREALPVQQVARGYFLGATVAQDRVVVVGERGSVALSDDHARHWRQATKVPTSTTLTTVRAGAAGSLWAVGHGGVVLHSADQGEHWMRQLDGRAIPGLMQQEARAAGDAGGLAEAERLMREGADKPLLDLAVDGDTVLAVGAYGWVLRSRDAGRQWESLALRLPNPKRLHLYALGLHEGTLYLAGEQGLLLRSGDAGASFQTLPTPYAGSWFCLAVLDAKRLVVAGLRGHAYASHDGGQHWVALSGSPPVSFVSALQTPSGQVLLLNQAGGLFAVDLAAQRLVALSTEDQQGANQALLLSDREMLTLTPLGLKTVIVTGTFTAGRAEAAR